MTGFELILVLQYVLIYADRGGTMTTSLLITVGMAGLGRRPSCLISAYFPIHPTILFLTAARAD
jgi:hypothetical protein